MEEKIKHYLRPGEQVRWQGAPAPFQLMESGLKSQILIKWGVTAALCAALLAVYFYRTPEPNMGFVGLVLLVAVVVLVSPVLERRNLSGTRYWITDQRVILATRDETLYYMELDKIDAVQTLEGMTEKPCLVLGSSIAEEAPKRLRWRACHPKTDIQGHDHPDQALGMILYGLSDARAAEALLQREKAVKTA